MSKETLQHTMRSKVRVFEDGGIRLLRKGQKGLIHAIFSRFGLVLVLLVLQFGALFSLMRWFSNLLPHYLGGTLLVTAVMMVYLLNQDMNNSVRIPWLVVTALAPVLGVLLFCYTKEDVGHRMLKKRLLELEGQTRSQLPQNKKTGKALDADCPGAASLAQYLRGRGGGFPVYENTQVTYFPSGEAKFAALLPQLESATQYIFLEYFIIDEGLMWGRILEILARKAAQGVDVRVMYDGTCEFSTLPRDYPRRLEALGIQCKVFAPVTPFVSTHYNYRDHRKILVVDGRVGFTGGVNLADEYINHVEKYGRWKDAAVMLEGEGVRTMTALFLQMWSIQREPEFAQFLTRPLPETQANGFVIPYGDCPLDGERVGEMVYIDLLNRARHSVHIITPYLILDGELETALRFAAERGVDVHLILPGKPDKWFAYALAKTHYLPLLSSGVKISEWVPGFTHAKVMIMEGQEAVVGTINLDYRSLYHHFENAVWMRGVDCLPRIEADFQDTLAQCRTVEPTRQSVWQGKKLLHLVGMMLKFIAPLI
ncbi:phospholipase D-like domain-containing protein [Faecalibacterium sp. OM04-11BH]|uniref:phospholipase D-like domain-containing protein n=1 Tax=Faecalibacterium sp. OM04-11BH TaxID=2292357 RepID=UPI000E534B1F|nr:phospholipase D-like domain-containing protein [Faecalibacterium sp. OM04-11BH]RHV54336.1 cardiolipin synthase [Faecalibacterium sp. OM04-11BH]